MSYSWANPGDGEQRGGHRANGSDLHLDLAAGWGADGPRAARGRRSALIRTLRDAVRTGRLAPGTLLPPSRTLAADLGLARNTVAAAYSDLVAEGLLTARQGSGTRVAALPAGGPGETAGPAGPARYAGPAPPPGTTALHPRDREPGLASHRPDRRPDRGHGHRSDHRPVADLRSGVPDLSAFPRQDWLTSARRALTAAPADAFGYGDLRGRPELRRALADYLARARGVRTHPDRIVVCPGVPAGLTLLDRVLPGEVAVEEYGLSFHRDVFTAAGTGAATHPLTVDAHGARVDGLAELPSVRAVLLTPAHQYPTGAALRPERRAQVVDWARRRDGLVLEDDYDGEYRYDRRPVGALQSLDPERVVYLGTASKSLAPALRLAWMVLPEHLVERVLAAKRPAEWTTGAPDQLTLADFLDRGAYDRHVRAMRQRYRRRRDRLAAALTARTPRLRVTGVAAGLHAVVQLTAGGGEPAETGAEPAEPTESGVRDEAARRGLLVDVMSGFRHPSAVAAERAPALVVGYGAPAEHAFSDALERLCEVLSATGRGVGAAGADTFGGCRVP